MSGLGNYVHARMANYKKYGIGKSTKSNISIEDSYKSARDRIKAISGSRENAEIEDLFAREFGQFMTDLIYSDSENIVLKKDPDNGEKIEIAKKYFIDNFTKEIQDKFPNFIIKLKNEISLKKEITLPSNNAVLEIGQTIQKIKNIRNNQRYIQRKTYDELKGLFLDIERQFQSEKGLKSQVFGQIVSTNKGGDFIKDISKLQADWRALKSFFESEENNNQNGGKVIIKTRANSKIVRLMGVYANITQALYKGPTTSDQGDLGEYFLAYCASLFGATAGTVITREILDKIVVGSNNRGTNSLSRLDKNYFNLETFLKVSEQEKGLGSWQIDKLESKSPYVKITQQSNTLNTVDVKLDLEEIFKEDKKTPFGGRSVFKASMKNYTINDPTIISGITLLQTLELFDTSFGNHYLNVISHTTFPDSLGQKIQGTEDRLFANYQNQRTVINKYLSIMVAVRGLSGIRSYTDNKFSNRSDFFVLNKKVGKRVHVVSTSRIIDALLEQLTSDINLSADWIDDRRKVSPPPDQIAQAYVGTTNNYGDSKERISSLLGQLTHYKLGIKLKASSLGELFPSNIIK